MAMAIALSLLMKMVKLSMVIKLCIIIGRYLHSEGRLKSGTIVSTIMSNLGFYKALSEHGMTV